MVDLSRYRSVPVWDRIFKSYSAAVAQELMGELDDEPGKVFSSAIEEIVHLSEKERVSRLVKHVYGTLNPSLRVDHLLLQVSHIICGRKVPYDNPPATLRELLDSFD